VILFLNLNLKLSVIIGVAIIFCITSKNTRFKSYGYLSKMSVQIDSSNEHHISVETRLASYSSALRFGRTLNRYIRYNVPVAILTLFMWHHCLGALLHIEEG